MIPEVQMVSMRIQPSTGILKSLLFITLLVLQQILVFKLGIGVSDA